MILIGITREADDTAFFDLQATLDDVTYTLEFRWNDRLQAWFMNVYDAEGATPYQLGIRLVADWLLGQYISSRQPTGVFLALDTGAPDGEGQDPGFDDLGNRVQLYYVPRSELG